MARPQENSAPFTTPYSPIIERGRDYDDDDLGGGCGCFWRFCLGRDEGGYLLQQSVHEEAWYVSQLKKLNQLSELVAGPKWKNLMRKIGRLCHHKKQPPPPFQYSPESYALNFAGDQDKEDGGNPLHSFSARFGPRAAAGTPININDAAL